MKSSVGTRRHLDGPDLLCHHRGLSVGLPTPCEVAEMEALFVLSGCAVLAVLALLYHARGRHRNDGAAYDASSAFLISGMTNSHGHDSGAGHGDGGASDGGGGGDGGSY